MSNDTRTREKRSPGRPRSEHTRQAILDAARRLLATGPYRDVSIDRLAAEAKVGKQSIYRWWPAKADVLLEAELDRFQALAAVPPESEDCFASLQALLERHYAVLVDARARQGLRCLLAEAQLDPAFADRLHSALTAVGRRAVRTIFDRGRASGAVRADLDYEVLVDVIVGAMWYRLLCSGEPGCAIAYASTVVDMVRALAATDPSKRRPSSGGLGLFEA